MQSCKIWPPHWLSQSRGFLKAGHLATDLISPNIVNFCIVYVARGSFRKIVEVMVNCGLNLQQQFRYSLNDVLSTVDRGIEV